MINVVPYSDTVKSEKFKTFLEQPFNIAMLNTYNPSDNVIPLFDGWKNKYMSNWYRYSNDDGHVLEYYPDYYVIKKKNQSDTSYTLSHPPTINDFINDMNRLGIKLYWTNWIDENFEPKEYLHKDGIYGYFLELLGKMGKSHELN